MKIKAYTSVNEHTNTHYYSTFTVVDVKPEGEWKGVSIDRENDSKAFDYDYFVNRDGEKIAIKQNYPENYNEACLKAYCIVQDISREEAADIIYDDDIAEEFCQYTDEKTGRPILSYHDMGSGKECEVYLDNLEIAEGSEE